MSAQPEALRLADVLEFVEGATKLPQRAADELHRLLNEYERIRVQRDELLKFLRSLATDRLALVMALKVAERKLRELEITVEHELGDCRPADEMEASMLWSPELYTVRAAIGKATGEQK